MSSTEIVITLLGIGLVLIAFLIELEHKIIWKRYKANYHPHKNQFINDLLKPNKIVYGINVYLLWPLIFVLGIAVLLKNSLG